MILSVFSPVWPLVVGTNSHNYLDIVDHSLMLICFNHFSKLMICFGYCLCAIIGVFRLRFQLFFQLVVFQNWISLNFCSLVVGIVVLFTGCWHSSSPVLQECASRRWTCAGLICVTWKKNIIRKYLWFRSFHIMSLKLEFYEVFPTVKVNLQWHK